MCSYLKPLAASEPTLGATAYEGLGRDGCAVTQGGVGRVVVSCAAMAYDESRLPHQFVPNNQRALGATAYESMGPGAGRSVQS